MNPFDFHKPPLPPAMVQPFGDNKVAYNSDIPCVMTVTTGETVPLTKRCACELVATGSGRSVMFKCRRSHGYYIYMATRLDPSQKLKKVIEKRLTNEYFPLSLNDEYCTISLNTCADSWSDGEVIDLGGYGVTFDMGGRKVHKWDHQMEIKHHFGKLCTLLKVPRCRYEVTSTLHIGYVGEKEYLFTAPQPVYIYNSFYSLIWNVGYVWNSGDFRDPINCLCSGEQYVCFKGNVLEGKPTPFPYVYSPTAIAVSAQSDSLSSAGNLVAAQIRRNTVSPLIFGRFSHPRVMFVHGEPVLIASEGDHYGLRRDKLIG